MADNKKKKVNWRDSLASEAAKMKETVTVYVDGKPHELPRGDMSDEEWADLKKRAAADAAKQPERWSGDVIIAKTSDGGRTTVTRENQTDEEWARVVADVRKQYGERNIEERNMAPEHRGWGEEWGPGTIFPTRKDYQRLQAMPAGPEKKAELERLKAQYDAEQPAADVQREFKGAQKATDAAKKRLLEQKAATNQQERDEEQASADPGMSVRGQMMRMATGATPAKGDSLEQANKNINATSDAAMGDLPGTRKPKGPVNALKSLIAEDAAAEAAAKEPSVVQPTKLYGGDAVSHAAAEDSKVIPIDALRQSVRNELLTPAQQQAEESQRAFEAADARGNATGESDLNSLNNFATEARQAITDVVTDPMGTVVPALKRLGQGAGEILAAGGPFGAMPQSPQPQLADPLDPNTPVAPPANVQPPVPVPGAQGGSMSVSARIPGIAAPPAPPPESDYEKQIKQAAREGQALISAKSALDQEKAAKDMETFAAHQVQREKMVLDEQMRQKAFEDTMAGYERGVRDLQRQVLDLSKQDIDPNRFWNSKDAGQKASAIIAGALFGFTGQGMQWLQRIDSLVAQDIQAQSADLQRKRGLLSDASQLQNNLVAMAEAKGLRGKAAFDAAQAMTKEKLANDLMMNAMNYAQPDLKIKAEQAAMELRNSAAKDLYNVKRQGELDALNKRKIMSEIHQNEAAAYAARVAAQSRGHKDSEDMKLPPGTREELAKVEKGLEAIQQARKALGTGSWTEKLGDEVANAVRGVVSALPGKATESIGMAMTPDTTGRTAVAESAQETALKAVMGEALQEKDIERNRPRFARPGLAAGNTKWLDSQEEVLLAKKNALINSKRESDLTPGVKPLHTLTPAGR